MKRAPVSGILLVLAGITLALVPYAVLPVCAGTVETASGGSVPMKCFWTAKAELGVGSLITFGGLLSCFSRDAGARFGIAAMTAGTALLGIAFPTALIGVCPSEAMACRMGTLPALVLINSVVAVISLFACRNSRRAMKRGGER